MITESTKTYELNGKQLKPELLKSDLSEEMGNRAFELAFKSLNKYSIEVDIANYIKEHFDNEFLPSWQCITGIY